MKRTMPSFLFILRTAVCPLPRVHALLTYESSLKDLKSRIEEEEKEDSATGKRGTEKGEEEFPNRRVYDHDAQCTSTNTKTTPTSLTLALFSLLVIKSLHGQLPSLYHHYSVSPSPFSFSFSPSSFSLSSSPPISLFLPLSIRSGKRSTVVAAGTASTTLLCQRNLAASFCL